MKNILALVLLLFGTGHMAAQLGNQQDFNDNDTTIVLFSKEGKSLSCTYEKWGLFKFVAEDGENQAEVYISNSAYNYLQSVQENSNVYVPGLEMISLNKKVPEAGSALQYVPCNYYLFFRNQLRQYFSDIRRTQEREYKQNAGAETEYWKYLYNVLTYSKGSHQMIADGDVSCFFFDYFNFGTDEGEACGTWSVLKDEVVKKKESLAGSPEYRFNNIHYDLNNKSDVLGREVCWTITQDEFILEFSPYDTRTIIVVVKYSDKPYVSRILQKESDEFIEHTFAGNGNLATLAVKDKIFSGIYFYDTEKRYMVARQEKGFHSATDNYIEETFDVEKEYETVDIAPVCGFGSDAYYHLREKQLIDCLNSAK